MLSNEEKAKIVSKSLKDAIGGITWREIWVSARKNNLEITDSEIDELLGAIKTLNDVVSEIWEAGAKNERNDN